MKGSPQLKRATLPEVAEMAILGHLQPRQISCHMSTFRVFSWNAVTVVRLPREEKARRLINAVLQPAFWWRKLDGE